MSDIDGIHHTGLHVRDIERSVAFYRDVIGLEVIARRESNNDYAAQIVGYPGAVLQIGMLRHPSGGPILELIQYVEPEGTPIDTATPNPGTAHVCFLVSDIHATFARLQAVGVSFKSDAPVTITLGINTGGFAAYCTDPDGITLELLQTPYR